MTTATANERWKLVQAVGTATADHCRRPTPFINGGEIVLNDDGSYCWALDKFSGQVFQTPVRSRERFRTDRVNSIGRLGAWCYEVEEESLREAVAKCQEWLSVKDAERVATLQRRKAIEESSLVLGWTNTNDASFKNSFSDKLSEKENNNVRFALRAAFADFWKWPETCKRLGVRIEEDLFVVDNEETFWREIAR